MTAQKLNVGCGKDIRSGWVNLDSAPLPGVDVVHDIQQLPLPFKDERFDEILCQDILEHIEYIPVLRDLHRILKPGGVLTVRVPHFTSKNNFIDPTHRKLFSVDTFDFFVEGTKLSKERDYYFGFFFGSTLGVRLTFERHHKIFLYNMPVEWLINRSRNFQKFYESSFLGRLFPAENIIVRLQK